MFQLASIPSFCPIQPSFVDVVEKRAFSVLRLSGKSRRVKRLVSDARERSGSAAALLKQRRLADSPRVPLPDLIRSLPPFTPSQSTARQDFASSVRPTHPPPTLTALVSSFLVLPHPHLREFSEAVVGLEGPCGTMEEVQRVVHEMLEGVSGCRNEPVELKNQSLLPDKRFLLPTSTLTFSPSLRARR
jgi:hypothetical protein